jgi:hypothetical protein
METGEVHTVSIVSWALHFTNVMQMFIPFEGRNSLALTLVTLINADVM